VRVFVVQDSVSEERDYTIAIFSTREKAQDFILRAKEQLYGDTPIKRYESLEIVVYELDWEP
jgi:hypothetical protein